jgi:hypothetical protein
MILMVRLGEWDTFHDGCDAPATMVFRAVEDVCNGRGCVQRPRMRSRGCENFCGHWTPFQWLKLLLPGALLSHLLRLGAISQNRTLLA